MSSRELTLIAEQLRSIANSLERIEKTLPGCNQESLREEIKKCLTSILASECTQRTHLEYK